MSLCRACESGQTVPFYASPDVPVSSCAIVTSFEEAEAFPQGSLRLSVCPRCGFIQNDLFDPSLVDYTQGYEESQGSSPTFRSFVDETIAHLIATYDLAGKDLLEIGCGKGEWLARACELGTMNGTGIDPAYVPGRLSPADDERITVLREFYGEDTTDLTGDLIACRHTLEHIGPVRRFAELLAKSARKRPGSVLFIEVPDVTRILREGAFWDIYYEHAAYFAAGSLTALLRRVGFPEVSVRLGYADQYLLAEARIDHPVAGSGEDTSADEMLALAGRFEALSRASVNRWNDWFRSSADLGRTVAVWGASSKAVGFLSALEYTAPLQYAIDINPMKQGLFLPGSGLEIKSPDVLTDRPVDAVIAMNPIYLPEIASTIAALGASLALLTPEGGPSNWT